jgi:predicted lipoprotein with Yx(FWY)xxD motif
VRAAPGYVLTDARGLPLYGCEGDRPGAEAPKPGAEWIPFAASQAALPVGDFTIIPRFTGLRQWAYRGRPLYRYANDLDYGDANGKDVSANVRLVFLLHYFMPEGVTMVADRDYGDLLVLKDGTRLYARETSNGGSLGPRRDPGRSNVGKTIGVAGCDEQCERFWKPLIAPDDAKPNGYWSLYARPDGKKQWAYYGHALYSPVSGAPPADLYDRTNNFEALPSGGVREVLPMHWRLTPP